MKIAELFEYDNFPSLCFAIGLGFVYYYVYWGSRLMLSRLIRFLTSVLPSGFFFDPITGEKLSVVITANIVEFIIAAIATGIIVAILFVWLYHENVRFFGSIAIVLYALMTLVPLSLHLISDPRKNETWVLMLKLVRPFVVSAIFYSLLVFMAKKRRPANDRLHRVANKSGSQ